MINDLTAEYRFVSRTLVDLRHHMPLDQIFAALYMGRDCSYKT